MQALTEARQNAEFDETVRPHVQFVRRARMSNAMIVELKPETKGSELEVVRQALLTAMGEETNVKALVPMEELACHGVDASASREEFARAASKALDMELEGKDILLTQARDGSSSAYFRVPLCYRSNHPAISGNANWRVSEEYNGSDHNALRYFIGTPQQEKRWRKNEYKFNGKRWNEAKFDKAAFIEGLHWSELNNREQDADSMRAMLSQACDTSMPR
uniref:Uncharacterized protein n=1 Tax=Anopheles atroparvus TaxID=41427 RepID=A0A182IYU1_ANOAO